MQIKNRVMKDSKPLKTGIEKLTYWKHSSCTHLYLFRGNGGLGLVLKLILFLKGGGWPSGLQRTDDGSRAVHRPYICSKHTEKMAQNLKCILLKNLKTQSSHSVGRDRAEWACFPDVCDGQVLLQG